jgi:hypothetical protein
LGDDAFRAGVPVRVVARADRQRERRVTVALERVAEREVDGARVVRPREDRRVDAGRLHPERKRPGGQQQRGGDERHGDRALLHERRDRVPASAVFFSRSGLERQCVHARPEHGQQRGDDDDGGERREQGHERPAESHRVQEPLREQTQGHDGRSHGERAEDHGPARGPERRRERFHAGPVLFDLLAVARDEEEAVVDGEAETQGRHEVERGDGDRNGLVEQPETGRRSNHRNAAERERQHRGDQAAEDDDEQNGQDREGDELRTAEIALGGGGDRFEGDRVATHAHVEAVRLEAALQVLDQVPVAVLRRRAEIGLDQGGLAVAGQQLGVLHGPLDAGDAVLLADLVREPGDLPLSLRPGEPVFVVEEEDEAGVDVVAGGVLEPVHRPDAFAVRILELRQRECAESAGAVDRHRDHADGTRSQHEPRAAVHESRPPLKHRALPPCLWTIPQQEGIRTADPLRSSA